MTSKIIFDNEHWVDTRKIKVWYERVDTLAGAILVEKRLIEKLEKKKLVIINSTHDLIITADIGYLYQVAVLFIKKKYLLKVNNRRND